MTLTRTPPSYQMDPNANNSNCGYPNHTSRTPDELSEKDQADVQRTHQRAAEHAETIQRLREQLATLEMRRHGHEGHKNPEEDPYVVSQNSEELNNLEEEISEKSRESLPKTKREKRRTIKKATLKKKNSDCSSSSEDDSRAESRRRRRKLKRRSQKYVRDTYNTPPILKGLSQARVAYWIQSISNYFLKSHEFDSALTSEWKNLPSSDEEAPVREDELAAARNVLDRLNIPDNMKSSLDSLFDT
ncbi:hypothetical protein P9112_005241 [Eukaryota sp. TZLM1-RC]